MMTTRSSTRVKPDWSARFAASATRIARARHSGISLMEKMARSMATTMNATTTPMARMMAGSRRPISAPQLAAHLGLHGVGGLEQHVLQASRLLADADHVDGQRREGRVFLHGRRHRPAALHGVGQTMHGAAHDLVGHDVADHGQGAQDRHPAPQHGPKVRAKRAVSTLIMSGPTRGTRRRSRSHCSRPSAVPVHSRQRQDDPDDGPARPPTSRTGGPGSSRGESGWAGEWPGPCPRRWSAKRGITKVIRNTMAAGPDGRDDDGVDQGGDDGLREGLARLLKLGQPAQGGLEHAALLARADHVDVQAREGAGMVLGEGIAERGAARARCAGGRPPPPSPAGCGASSSRMESARSSGMPASTRVASCWVRASRSRARMPAGEAESRARPAARPAGVTLTGK